MEAENSLKGGATLCALVKQHELLALWPQVQLWHLTYRAIEQGTYRGVGLYGLVHSNNLGADDNTGSDRFRSILITGANKVSCDPHAITKEISHNGRIHGYRGPYVLGNERTTPSDLVIAYQAGTIGYSDPSGSIHSDLVSVARRIESMRQHLVNL